MTIAVSLAQIDVTALDAPANRARMVEIAEIEARAGAALVLFPELANTGYVEPPAPGRPMPADRPQFAEYAAAFAAAAEPLGGPTLTALAAVAARHGMRIVAGLALRCATVPGRLSNSSVLIGPAGVEAVYHKLHLWHNEALYFTRGNAMPEVVPGGVGGLGMQVCYDIRFPEITRVLALRGAQVVTNVWASFRPEDEAAQDPALFRHRAYTRAQENGLFFLSCNRVGAQSGFRFMGHSVICAPDGRVIAEAAHEREEVLRAELDMAEVARYRGLVGLFNNRRPELYGALCDPGLPG